MPAQSFEFDTQTGSVRYGGIRYLMMRPDVLMGVGTALGSIDQFVNALTESAFQNARASFEVYRRNGLLDSDGALQRAGEFAAWLGWGRWFVAYLENGNVEVIVRHSPFSSEAHTSQLQSLMRSSYSVLCMKHKQKQQQNYVSDYY